jgi:membrane-associated phospholipid phosphatase
MEFIKQLFYSFGGYGPGLLGVASVILLWEKQTLLRYYIVGLFFNTLLNFVLKGIFQQPRPSVDEKLFNASLKHGIRFIYKDGIPSDIFGMPSGHSESVFYSTLYVFFALRNYTSAFIYLLFSLITGFQRVYFHYHTVMQVIVGAIVGAVFSYFVYCLALKQILGDLKEKQDDDAPI